MLVGRKLVKKMTNANQVSYIVHARKLKILPNGETSAGLFLMQNALLMRIQEHLIMEYMHKP